MKNILLASTALVAFGGAAAAEVVITGDGRMGIIDDYSISAYDDADPLAVDPATGLRYVVGDDDVAFTSRVRIAFTLTSETDSGVSFGGSIRADNAKGGANGSAGNVFMTGAFGKLSMGDVSGAAEAAVGNVSGVGLTGLRDLNEALYLQQGNNDVLGNNQNEQLSAFALPAALYEYSSGGFTGYVGLGNPAGISLGDSIAFPTVENILIDNAYGLGGKYATDTWWVGAGYENLDLSATDVVTGEEASTNVDNWIIGGGGTFDAFTLNAQYGQGGTDNLDFTQYALSVDYTFDATTLTAYYRNVELDYADDTLDGTRNPFGVGASYDLGGGAAVKVGIVDPDVQGVDMIWDAGVSFSF